MLRFLLFPPGKVEFIEGLEKAREVDGVVACDLYIRQGDILVLPVMDTQRHGYLITVGDSLEEAQHAAGEVEGKIRGDSIQRIIIMCMYERAFRMLP